MNTLTIGTGFINKTSIDYVGTSDCKAIARWSSIPYQNSDRNIGVIAFHKDGIDRVEFSANDGPWFSVSQPSLNPKTNINEYYVELNPEEVHENRVIEIRAIVYPKNNGIPRILQGSLEGLCVDKIKQNSFYDGNHSMYVTSNKIKATAWVSNSGNDISADGTEYNPYLTIQYAAMKLSQQNNSPSNCRIFLKSGQYTIGAPQTNISPNYGWLTIESAPGLSREDVSIIGCSAGGMKVRLLHFKNVKFYNFIGIRTSQTIDSFLWVEKCLLTTDSNQIDTGGLATSGWMGVYATECEAINTRNSFRMANLVRNCKAYHISETPLGANSTVINFICDNYVKYQTDHADVLHWFWNDPGTRENRIIYGLKATRFGTQGFYTEPRPSGGQRLDNLAMVNVHVSQDNNSQSGSWFTMDSNHTLLWNVQMPDQPIRITVAGGDRDDDKIFDMKNLDIRNCIFQSLHGIGVNLAKVNHLHLLEPIYGYIVPTGNDVTLNWMTGKESIFVDVLEKNYTIKPGTVADKRVPMSETLTLSRIDGMISTSGERLSNLLDDWGTSSSISDINKDGMVDGVDLSLLLSQSENKVPLGAFI